MSSNGSAEPPGAPAGADDGDRELRAARRTLVLLIVAAGAVLAGVVMLVSGDRGDDGSPKVERSIDDPVVDATVPDERVRSLGPAAGTAVGAYVDERTEALRNLEGDVVAVVSLTGYSTESTVEDLLEDVELDSYLVAVTGGGPRRTTDVDETVAAVVADAEAQLAELQELLPTIEDDPEFAEFYADEIERFRQIIDAENDDVVFALVVTGTAADLRSLASRASVRLVDARDDVDLDAAAVAGLRPEEREVVGEPPFRP